MKTQEELARIVLDRSKEVNGKRILTCAEALSLAAELGVEPRQIGSACDQGNVRLGSCQLGCFS
jgi:hypothetical protein